jgi:hypothetical protein
LSPGSRRGAARRDHPGGAEGRGCLVKTRHPRPIVIERVECGASPSAASAVLAARMVALDGAALDGQPAFGSRTGLRCGF